MLKISRVPFGVLAANSRVPSGDMASGRTWPLSNSRKEGPLEAADTLLSESWKPTRANALMSIHSARTHALAFRCDLRMVRGSFHGLMFRPFWAGSGRPRGRSTRLGRECTTKYRIDHFIERSISYF